MSGFEICSGASIHDEELNAFLRQVYPPAKSEFIIRHADWLYRSRENQWVVHDGRQIVAYCAVIPTNCLLQGRRVPALWWVDLIVDAAFRGRGIQTQIDTRMRAETDLKLGFPNDLAAKIHRKHQWGVREDGQIHLLPLKPLGVSAVRRSAGLRGLLLKSVAALSTPVMKGHNWRFRREQSGRVRSLAVVDAEELAAIFERFVEKMPATTYRDADFIRWRYLQAPYANELHFYVGGPQHSPTHCLIARHVEKNGEIAVRILDLFGNLDDMAGVQALLRLVVADAVQAGASQVTAMSFLPELSTVLQRLGFFLSMTGRFCWHSPTAATLASLNSAQHWTLGDSDNDASG